MPRGGQGREGVPRAAAQGLQRRRHRQVLRDEAPALTNSLGLLAASALVLWQAFERLRDPMPVVGWFAVVRLGAAAANGAVAWLLRSPARDYAAIRLAYIHNLGSAFASLAPVLAGVLASAPWRSFFDPHVAGGIAAWIVVSTAREVRGSRDELIWPGKLVCGHPERH
ncbi:MAG TPA: cation transporter [Burkholderiales bacterium]|nr:cation transporter [Burkholderiales bacterium]